MKSLILALAVFAATNAIAADFTLVTLETNRGKIVMELDSAKAPLTVSNFLAYVDSGFFKKTIIHRVIPGFVIQGGGLTATMVEKPTLPAIVNEAGNGLSNLRGTISMARTEVVDSATSQFFINVADNVRLDHRNETPAGFGYAVFGKVVSGMNVADAMARVKTKTVGDYDDVPVKPIIILAVTRTP